LLDGGLLGWATASLVKLDDQAPGIIARVLTASPARRQSIFAALAAHEINGGLTCAHDALLPMTLAEVVRHGRSSDILRHAFRDVPQGFPGLLERIGDRPLPHAPNYVALHDLAGGDIRSAAALRDSGRITLRKLEVLSSLDPRWRHANALARIDTPAEAIRFNSAVQFVQEVASRATDEAVAAAIANMTPLSSLAPLLDRFVRRADRLPQHPVQDGDNELRPFTTMRDYVNAARAYRNCLADKLGHVAAGRLAVAEFRDEALLEFRPMTAGAGWMLWAIHGSRNSPVPLHVCQAADAKIDALGVPRLAEGPGGTPWSSFRAFTRELDWD
jgi:hypothetical protein